jgi:hypothetical protein
LYYPMHRAEWLALHDVREALPGGSSAQLLLAGAIDAIQQRAEERFAMVVWSFADLAVAVMRASGDEAEYGAEPTLEEAGLTLEMAGVLADEADRLVSDAMTMAGWDALDAALEMCLLKLPGAEGS